MYFCYLYMLHVHVLCIKPSKHIVLRLVTNDNTYINLYTVSTSSHMSIIQATSALQVTTQVLGLPQRAL